VPRRDLRLDHVPALGGEIVALGTRPTEREEREEQHGGEDSSVAGSFHSALLDASHSVDAEVQSSSHGK